MPEEKRVVKKAVAKKTVTKPKSPKPLKTIRVQSASHWMRSPVKTRKEPAKQ